MKRNNVRLLLAGTSMLLVVASTAGLATFKAAGNEDAHEACSTPAKPQTTDARFTPYSDDPEHPWNQLHDAMFVRETPDGKRHIHTTDPLLFPGASRKNTYLFKGEIHDNAVVHLDSFIEKQSDKQIDNPLPRLMFQRDLWAAFDYAAWYPDEWVYRSKYEPAAIALRTRLAQIIGRLALNKNEIDALPDNYAMAVKAKQYPAKYDPKRPSQPFLPADIFDRQGPWVRLMDSTPPMAKKHFAFAGGRAAHIIFIRLPGGRAATQQYLKELNRDAIKQFPAGSMVAMVRKAIAVEAATKRRLHVTPITELVQIRVYRRIPEDPRANHHGDFGEQDVYEFVLDRKALFAGKHGLRAVGPDEPVEPFARSGDPFIEEGRSSFSRGKQLQSCIFCHQRPGIYSVTSAERGLEIEPVNQDAIFRTYSLAVQLKSTLGAKSRRYEWGLLQGLLEAQQKQQAKSQ